MYLDVYHITSMLNSIENNIVFMNHSTYIRLYMSNKHSVEQLSLGVTIHSNYKTNACSYTII